MMSNKNLVIIIMYFNIHHLLLCLLEIIEKNINLFLKFKFFVIFYKKKAALSAFTLGGLYI